MSLRRVCSTLLILCLLITATACSSSVKKEEKETPLSIYIMEYDLNAKNAVGRYNKLHENAKIQEKIFFMDQQEQLDMELNSELASGGGPDVIIFKPESFKNLSKHIEKSHFYDFNELLEADSSFRLGDFNQEILDSGVIGGKRLFIPLCYNMASLLSTKDILEKSKLSLSPEGNQLKDLSGIGKEFLPEQEGAGKYLMNSLDINLLIQSASTNFIDIAGKKAQLDSDGFIKLLNEYKSLYFAVKPSDTAASASPMEDVSRMLKDGGIVLIDSPRTQLRNIGLAYAAFDAGADPVMLPYPVVEGEGRATAVPDTVLAINSNCKYRKGAFEYIKLLLSEEFQSSAYMYNMPVNRKAYEKIKQDTIKTEGAGGLKPEALKTLYKRLDWMTGNIGEFRLVDSEIMQIIRNELQEVLKGGKSAGDAAKAMQRKTEEYFATGLIVDSTEPEALEKKTLKISYVSDEWNVKNAVKEYEKLYKNVDLQDEVYFASGPMDAYREKLTAELLAGDGPDIIIGSTIWTKDGAAEVGFENVFPNIQRTVQSGLYCDLNELIAADKEFRLTDYYEKILNCGVFDGKRYFIPVTFKMDAFMTTKKHLEENGIIIDPSGWTWKDAAEIAKAFRNKNKGKEKYLFESNLSFIQMLYSSGAEFVDFKNRKASFNSPDFIELLKAYKDIFPSICPAEVQDRYTGMESWFNNGVCVLLASSSSTPNSNYCMLCSFNSAFLKAFGQELEYYPYPTLKGRKAVYPVVFQTAGINSRCKAKKEAFDFVKLLLSKEFQTYFGYDNGNGIHGQVNKEAYASDKDSFSKDKYGSGTLPKRAANVMDSMVQSLEAGRLINAEINKMIAEEVKYYISGKKTAEKTAEAIDGKVTILLNE